LIRELGLRAIDIGFQIFLARSVSEEAGLGAPGLFSARRKVRKEWWPIEQRLNSRVFHLIASQHPL
jgi:hypothetical protein